MKTPPRRLCMPRYIALLLIFVLLVPGCRPQAPAPVLEAPTVVLPVELSQPPGALPSETPAVIGDGSPAVVALAAQLQGLSIDDFFEASWRALLLRDPEWVLEAGLEKSLGVVGAQLTNISDDYLRENYRLVEVVRHMLRQYDRAALTREQQLSYDVYLWYLEDRLAEEPFMYYDYPATYYPITAVQERLISFFVDIHPLSTAQDARDYVTRLGLVGAKIDQLLEGLELRKQAGVVPPKFALQWAIYGNLGELAHSSPESMPFYTNFESKLAGIEGLDAAEKETLLAQARDIIAQSVLPAYKKLTDDLKNLEKVVPQEDGVWQFPQGEAYYNYLLRHHNSTSLSTEEIHQIGLEELERIHAEMRAVFDELGYPQDEGLEALYNRVAEESGFASGRQALTTFETLIAEAEQKLDMAFEQLPQARVIVVEDEFGGYYVPASLDGSRPGVFYASVGGQPRFEMPTLVYHETIPGHHLQLALAQEMDLPLFRRMIPFNGYIEGWALYAERLAWELGWYEDDPYGNLGRLQFEAYRAARLVIDTGIHAKRWNFNQAKEFMRENVGFPDPRNEIARYIVMPGQATAYDLGFIEMLRLRQQVQDALGERFDLKDFHSLILSSGSMPLEILEQVVADYIQAQQAQGGLSETQADTLASLQKVDDYPLYTMSYVGSYNPALAISSKGMARTWQAAPDVSQSWACSLFTALADPLQGLYGRNFDWNYSPALLLFTDPPGGYASVSIVDLAYLVDSPQVARLAELPLAERTALLDAPFLPFDGMNELGLAIGMAAVPAENMPPDPQKSSIDSLLVMREVLDYAKDVDEAAAILQKYNIIWGSGPALHYLVADRSGQALLVEFAEGKVVLIPNQSPWHLATNFLRATAGEPAKGNCWRYDRLEQRLSQAGGSLSMSEAMEMLSQAAQENTQWSVVYAIGSGEVRIVMNRQYDAVHTYQLK